LAGSRADGTSSAAGEWWGRPDTRASCVHRIERTVAGVRCRMDVLGPGSSRQGTAIGLYISKQIEPLGDMRVARIQLCSPSIGVNGIGDLVVAAFIKRAKIEPDFGDIRVDPNGARVSVQGIAELIDVVIEDANAAPERRVAPVAIHCLLVGFVGLLVFLAGHVSTTQEVPALGIARI
jgi:hypothetical protein